MKYKILWADMHSNPHHEQIRELSKWIEHARKNLDFWPVAYYPYYSRKLENGLILEDMYDEKAMNEDWEYIRKLTEEQNADGFPMFMGYEWQGSGEDGDHNVFFRNNDGQILMPAYYRDLAEGFRGQDVIGITHHLAYQRGYRGKNWDTHDEAFSPFAEIYSSHGSSENDNGPLGMKRHVHMGPRTGETCVEQGLDRGYRLGIMASGDNHLVPGVFSYGSMAALAISDSKDDIWDALVNRRVYGVSGERIMLDFTINDQPMGSVIGPDRQARLHLEVTGSNAIDRIEIIRDNIVEEMIPHTSTWEKMLLSGRIRFKFRLEVGWGPNMKMFPEMAVKHWSGSLHTPGKLLSIENVWSSYGQDVTEVTENSCSFELTTYQRSAQGLWMGSEEVTTEGFIFEIEDDIDSSVILFVDGTRYELSIRDILATGKLFAQIRESEELLRERFGFNGYYRTEPSWRNAYKIKIDQGAPEIGYHRIIEREIDTTDCQNVRIRVYQKNGSVAWSSPIFIGE